MIFDVAGLLLREKFRDQDGNLEVWRYPELTRITEQWFDQSLKTVGKTPKQYLKLACRPSGRWIGFIAHWSAR